MSVIRKSGFTMVELMIASAISTMVSITMLSFYMVNYKIGFVSQERNEINADIRTLTSQLIRDGREANYFVLYDSIQAEDRNHPADRQLDGQAGDFLVFVQHQESTSVGAPTLITNIVAYYRSLETSEANELAPVRRLELVINPGSAAPLEDLLPDQVSLIMGREVIELSRGLANGRLFYNFWGRSIMVNGQIHHGNEAKRVTETYNFTVSPRG